MLRGLIEETGTATLATALETLGTDVAIATTSFSGTAVIRAQIAEVLGAGAGLLWN
jgi:hypothetical protein